MTTMFRRRKDLIDEIGILTTTKAWAAGLAGIALLVIGAREWDYNTDHPFARGTSGVLTGGFFAGAVVAFVVMLIARDVARNRAGVERLEESWYIAKLKELEDESLADEHSHDSLTGGR